MVLAGASAAGFAALAFVVTSGRAVPEIDRTIHDDLHAFAVGHAGWLTAMALLTRLGDTLTMSGITAVAAAFCVRQGRRRTAAVIVVAVLVTFGVSRLFRYLLHRPRPPDRLWDAAGYSFPSGHTVNAVTIGMVIAVACWPLVRRVGRIAVLAVAVVWPMVVGLTRVGGGVHWPTDVLGSILLTIACFAASLTASPPQPRSTRS